MALAMELLDQAGLDILWETSPFPPFSWRAPAKAWARTAFTDSPLIRCAPQVRLDGRGRHPPDLLRVVAKEQTVPRLVAEAVDEEVLQALLLDGGQDRLR